MLILEYAVLTNQINVRQSLSEMNENNGISLHIAMDAEKPLLSFVTLEVNTRKLVDLSQW